MSFLFGGKDKLLGQRNTSLTTPTTNLGNVLGSTKGAKSVGKGKIK